MIYCAYCGSYNVHTLECVELRKTNPKVCPKCQHEMMKQVHNTKFWECGHCAFVGHDPRIA